LRLPAACDVTLTLLTRRALSRQHLAAPAGPAGPAGILSCPCIDRAMQRVHHGRTLGYPCEVFVQSDGSVMFAARKAAT
jgi:hypothetical protein